MNFECKFNFYYKKESYDRDRKYTVIFALIFKKIFSFFNNNFFMLLIESNPSSGFASPQNLKSDRMTHTNF